MQIIYGETSQRRTFRSLDESLDALEDDHEFLLKGDVFTPQLIERWISYKREREIQPLRLRPHPLEFGSISTFEP